MKQEYNNYKNWKIGWKYKEDAPYDLQWQKDRRELFAEAGNGWWWYVGTKYLNIHINKIKKEREEKNANT
tara:strand:- start:159 stop:368 length:210 start_codon:yes stop_codon:yes gene_type:complete